MLKSERCNAIDSVAIKISEDDEDKQDQGDLARLPRSKFSTASSLIGVPLNTTDFPVAAAFQHSEPSPSTTPGIQRVPTEALLNIVSHIKDAPSLVCFALTTHRHLEVVLGYFKVTRLGQICPKDVRARFPPLLEPYAYNILIPQDDMGGNRYGWDNVPYVPIPDSATILPEFRCRESSLWKKVGHLSFTRRLAWFIDDEDRARKSTISEGKEETPSPH